MWFHVRFVLRALPARIGRAKFRVNRFLSFEQFEKRQLLAAEAQPLLGESALVAPASAGADVGDTAIPLPLVTDRSVQASSPALGESTVPLAMESVKEAPTDRAATTKSDSPLWGDSQDVVRTTVQSDGYGYGYGELHPPEIANFTATRQGSQWFFTGNVSDDEDVDGLTVRFGGLLEGYTASVNADGTFALVVDLPPESAGVVTAQVTDWDGLDSSEVQTQIW